MTSYNIYEFDDEARMAFCEAVALTDPKVRADGDFDGENVTAELTINGSSVDFIALMHHYSTQILRIADKKGKQKAMSVIDVVECELIDRLECLFGDMETLVVKNIMEMKEGKKEN